MYCMGHLHLYLRSYNWIRTVHSMVLDSFAYIYIYTVSWGVAHAINCSHFFVHFYVQTTVVLCIAQSSCPFQGENQGLLKLAFTTSMQVCRSTQWPLKRTYYCDYANIYNIYMIILHNNDTAETNGFTKSQWYPTFNILNDIHVVYIFMYKVYKFVPQNIEIKFLLAH